MMYGLIGTLNDLLGIIKDFLAPFLKLIGVEDEHIQTIFGLISFIMILSIIGYGISKIVNAFFLWRKQQFLNKDLHPFYTVFEIEDATKYFISTKYQDIAPSQSEDELGQDYIDSAKGKLIPMLLKTGFQDKSNHQHYLILADSGMGKTTFIINLYLKYKKQFTWGKPKYNIYLFPLGHQSTNEKIRSINNPTNSILLLDAFDEDINAVKNFEARMEEILKMTWEFRKVLITCRTQFFPSSKEETSSTGFKKFGSKGGEKKFRKQYISIFDDNDIRIYINKRFSPINPFNYKRRKKAKALISKVKYLMARPMLLSHIPDLANEDKDYNYSYQLYEVMIEIWVGREAGKPGIEEKYGSTKYFKSQLLLFSQNLAVNLYTHAKKRKGFTIYKEEKIDTKSGLQLSNLEEDMMQLQESDRRFRSLLNRNAVGLYKFSHKSILEYFLAKEMVENLEFFQAFNFDGMDASMEFVREMLFEQMAMYMECEVVLNNNPIPLARIGYKDLNNITELKIRNLYKNDISFLKIFSNTNLKVISIFDKTQFRTLYNLYSLFFVRHLEKLTLQEPRKIQTEGGGWFKRFKEGLENTETEKLNEKIDEIFNVIELQELKERLEKLKQKWQELSNLLPYSQDLQDLQKRLEHLDLQELQKQLELQELKYLPELRGLYVWGTVDDDDGGEPLYLENLLTQLKLLEPLLYIGEQQVLQAFKDANFFIAQCQTLEKALPNVKIYY